MGDFSAGLTAEALRRHNKSRSEAGMEMARDLGDRLITQEDVHTLQLCSWHAAEAIKKRLTNEGYPSEVRLSLATLIWNWINSPTLQDLEARRNELLAKLRPKERDYFLGYYQRQERQFVRAYTKKLANLGVESSQMAESSHVAIKEITNRHTPTSVAFEKICTYIEML